MIKSCQWCGEDFEAKGRSKYCKNTHYKNCESCEKEFIVKDLKSPRKGCSKSCSDALTKQNSPVLDKKCQLCGVSFETTDPGHIFCSNPHSANCYICHDSIDVIPLKDKKKYTCSVSCENEMRKQTNLERYGVENVNFAEETKNKIRSSYHSKSVEERNIISEKKDNTMMEKHGVKVPLQSQKIRDKAKETNIRKYGVENPAQHKEFQEESKKTNLERYGVEYTYQSELVKDKIKQSNLDKYGVEHPRQHNKELREKAEKTNLERYGSTNPFGSDEIQEKIRKTSLEKYGVEYTSQSESVKLKIKASMMRKYGVSSIFLLPENQIKSIQNNGKRFSKVNKLWKEKLDEKIGVSFGLEQWIGGNMYADMGYQDILIDINPTVTHNSNISFPHVTGRCKKDNCDAHLPMNPSYHQKRALLAEKNGKQLLQYFDWFDEEIFISIIKAKMMKSETKIFAKKTVLKEISQNHANKFLQDNHLIGRSNGQEFCLGLFHNDDLIHVQTYGPARISNKAEWEAIRSCSKINYVIPGAFSKCDKYFFNKINPDSVVSYIDLSVSQGKTELLFDGWNIEATNKPSATWSKLHPKSKDEKRFVKDSTARRISADRLLGFEVGDKYPRFDEDGNKVTNDFVLLSEGYVKVYDAGTRTILWRK